MSCEWGAGRFSDMGYYIPWWGMCQGDLLGEILGGCVVIRTPEAVSISNGTPLPLGEKRSGTKLEKTSLSTGGFLRVPYGYRNCLRLVLAGRKAKLWFLTIGCNYHKDSLCGGLAVQTEHYRLRADLIPAISEKRPSKPIIILHIIPGIANIGGNGHIATSMSKIAPMAISTVPFINELSLNFDFIFLFLKLIDCFYSFFR